MSDRNIPRYVSCREKIDEIRKKMQKLQNMQFINDIEEVPP
jgi:electron transfer flavoprotein alpha/beta subunit